ncbi:MAG: M12 family metallo-peptidase [Pyrinomonadaceae bacterium]
MKKTSRTFTIGCVVLGAVLTLTIAAFGQTKRSAFRIVEQPSARAADARTSIASVREAEIVVDAAALRGGPRSVITLPLFDDKVFDARQNSTEGSENLGQDNFVWRGKLNDGKFVGDVVLTYNKGYVSGLIYSPDAVYEIAPKGQKNILIELDQSLFPPCGGEIEGEKTMAERVTAPSGNTDSGDRIDVLVLYTAAVRTSAGGDTQAQTIAQQAIAATNTAYINSKIRQRVRLVGAELTALNETGTFSTELSNLRADTTTGARRDALKADLVDMLTNSTAACGIGYLMGSLPGSPDRGFSVTARTCAVGNLSFAHELGHNMGSQHNPENGSGPTFPYAFGHYVNGVFRTVMSYSDPCTSGCTRVAHFSNPVITYSGYATGIDNARDNARSINNTADSIANYRYSGSSIALTSYNGGEWFPRNIQRTVTWTTNNVTGNVRIDVSWNEGTTWRSVVASTPNDGSESFSIYGPATRHARIRVVSLSDTAVSDSSVNNISIR